MGSSRDGLVIFVLAGLFSFFVSKTVLNSAYTDNVLFKRQVSQSDCTTKLAGDLYGLGVRLGIYFQWFFGWVSNNFVIDEINGGLDANAIFMFAILIAMVNSTRTDDMTLMDGLIMLLLCAGTMWSVLSLWGYRTCVYRKEGLDGMRRFGGFGTHLRLLLGAGVSWYAIWYWLVGVKGLPRGLAQFGQVDDSCKKADVTIFGHSIDGIASRAALGVSSVALFYSIVVTLAAPIAGVTRLMKMISFLRNKNYGSTTRLRFATGANEKQLTIMSWVFCAFNLFWILFAMLLIELALNENHAHNVIGANAQNGQILAPAQLLPMLIGAFSFVRVLFVAYEVWRAPEGDITPSLGRQQSRRYAKTKVTKGLNIFKLFSSSMAEAEHNEDREAAHDSSGDWKDDHDDAHLNLHLRLNTFWRIVITLLPWVSLLWFWPWRKDIGRPLPPGDDTVPMNVQTRHPEPLELNTPHRTRFATFEDEHEEEEQDISYKRQPQPAFEPPYDPHVAKNMI